jgi:hypothetical protein
MKRAVMFYIVIAVAVSLLAPIAQAALGEVLLTEDKADVFLTVEIPSLETVCKYAESIAKQIGQEGASIRKEVVKGVFKISDESIIDFSKPVELVILNPKKFKMPMVMVFHVKDKDKFFANFGGDDLKLNEKTKDANIREYTKTESEFDNDAYMKDLEAGKEIKFEDYQKEVAVPYYVCVVDNIAISAGDMALAEKAIAAVGKKVEAKRIVSGDLQGTINIETIMTTYADEITKSTENLPIPQDPNMPVDIGKLLKLYVDAFVALGKSLDNMQFAANLLEKGDFGLQFAMVPKQGTLLEKMISTQEPKAFTYLAAFPEDASLTCAWNLNLTDDIATVYIKFVQGILGAMSKGALTEEDNEKMAEMIRQSFKATGKGGAISLGFSGAGMDIRGIYEIKDRALLEKSMKEGISFVMEKLLKPIMEGKEEMFKVEYKEGESPYKGASISKLIFDFKSDKMKEDEKEALKKMFGEQPAIYFGFTDKLTAMGMGNKGMETLKQTLDNIEKSMPKNVTTSASFTSATAGFPKEGIFLMYMSLGNFFKGAMEMLGGEGMPPGGAMMMQMFEKVSIAGYATKSGNALVFGTKIPVSDFLSMWSQLMMGPKTEEEAPPDESEEPAKEPETKEKEIKE